MSEPRSESLTIEAVYLGMRLPDDPRLTPDGATLAITETQLSLEANGPRTDVCVLVEEGEAWREVARFPGSLPRWSPDGATLAYVLPAEPEGGAGIALWSVASGTSRRLLAREGVGDLAWSPDGATLAFVAPQVLDRTPLDPIVVREVGYRAEGRPLPVPHDGLCLVGIEDGEPRTLVAEPFDVAFPCWHPDGRRIAFAGGVHPHWPSHAYVAGLDGALTRLTAEEGECEFVAWTPDGTRLVLVGKPLARSVGHRHLLVLDPETRALRRLAADFDQDVELSMPGYPASAPLVTPDGRGVLFTAYEGAGVGLFLAGMDGGATTRVCGEPREAIGTVRLTGDRLVAVVADGRTAAELLVGSLAQRSFRRVTDYAGDLFAAFPQAEEREFVAADGTVTHGLLLRGAGARDPGPLVLSVHGGPHSAFTAAISQVELLNWELALRGWNVLMMNPRGSVGYGEAYFRGVCGGWGANDMQDFMAALDALVAEGVADPDRLAVTGYSYGGFTTNWLITHTDRFAAAVSGGGPADQTMMYGLSDIGPGYTANELEGRPAERRELYDRLSPLRFADRVRTPVLFLHGTDDRRVPSADSEAMFTCVRDLGLAETELVLYEDCPHRWSRWPLSLRFDSDRRTVDWIERHVPGAPGPRAAPA